MDEPTPSTHSPVEASQSPSSANQDGAAAKPPLTPPTRKAGRTRAGGTREGGDSNPPPSPPEAKSPPPWTNFNEAPADPAALALENALRLKREREEKEAELVTREGYSWHIATRNHGSGKYRKDTLYLLPDGQNPDLFRKA